MPEIGKGRITPGTGAVGYTNGNAAQSTDGDSRSLLSDLRTRVFGVEDKLSQLTQDIHTFSSALSGLEELVTDPTGQTTSLGEVLSTYGLLNDQVDSLNTNLSVLIGRITALENGTQSGSSTDLTAINSALAVIDTRLDTLEPIVAAASTQITDLVAEVVNAVLAIEGKASQAGVDSIASSVITKANKSTKINTGGLISGGGDLTQDRSLLVAKASAIEVDAGIIDHKAVTPASLINVLASIRNIEAPIGIGTTNVINTRMWVPGTSGTQGKFTPLVTQSTATNAVALGAGPLNTIEPIWTATTLPAAVTAQNDINGGFEYCIGPCDEDFDPKQSYRFSVFVKQEDSSGVLNFMCENTVVQLNGQTVYTPAFLQDFNLPANNKWFLLVGLVHGSTFVGTDDSSGLYDPATGLRALSGISYKSKVGVGSQKLRIYRQNATVNASRTWLARPRIDIITGEEPTIRALFGTANDLDKVNKSTTVSAAGLATGGGDLSSNRVITVTKASDQDVIDGTSDTTVITPKGLKTNIAAVLPKASDLDINNLTSETTVVTPKSLRALRKATPSEVEARTANDVFVTPASLAGVSLGGGSGGSATPASPADVTAMTSTTKMVTPQSLTGLPKATQQQVADRTSTTVFVTPESLQGLALPDNQIATQSDVVDGTSETLLVTPFALRSFAQTLDYASGLDIDTGVSSTKLVTPAALAASNANSFANFDQSNDRNNSPVSSPTIASDGSAIDHVINTDGSATLSFEWSWADTIGDSPIDGFMVYVAVGLSSTPDTFSSGNENVFFVPSDKRAIVHAGVPANCYYTIAVRAYRSVDNDVNSTGYIYSALVHSTAIGEYPYRPSTNVAFAGDISGTINGVNVATITSVVQNFNNRNDRNGAAIAAPTISADGTAIDHVLNPDGSVSISFEWSWGGNNNDIDGFIVYERLGNTGSVYSFNGGPDEAIFFLPSDRRAAQFIGVPATRYYSFGVRAYRIVDGDIAATGYIMSPLVTPGLSAENPYRPSSGTVIGGADDGSGGVTVGAVVAAVSQAATAYSLATSTSATIGGLVDDGVITYVERGIIRRQIISASSERVALRTNATSLGVTTELVTENTAWTAMVDVLTSMVPPYDSTLPDSSPINRTDFNAKVATWTTALQNLANAVAIIAAGAATWNNIIGDGKPQDNATANVYRGEWADGVNYKVGDFVTYLGSSYSVLNTHTASSATPPPNSNLGLLTAGASVKTFTLSYANQFVRFGSDGLPKPASQSLSFTANLINTTDSTATFTATKYNSSNTSLGTITMGGSGNTRTLTETQFANASYVVVVATAPTDGLSDQATVIRITDGEAGLNGYLTNEAITLSADSGGTVSSFATANGQFKVYSGTTDVTSSAVFSVASQTGCAVTINSTGNYSVTSMSADNATASLQAVYNGVTFVQVLTLSKSKSGDIGVVGYLSNESHVVSADSAGTVASFVGAGGTFNVIYGLTNVTGTNTAFSVLSSTGCNVSINASTGVYVVNSMSADQGIATLRAVYSGVNPSVTIDKVYSITKSRAGAVGSTGSPGATSKVITLVSDRQVVTYNTAGAVSPSIQLTTFNVGKQNTTNTANWSIKDSLGNILTASAYLSATTGDTVTMTAANFNNAIAVNAANGVVVTVTVNDGVDYTDSVSVARVRDGSSAVLGYLTNEAQTLSASSAGAVTDFTPATGSFKVYFGITDVTSLSTVFAVSSQTGCTGTINASTGVYSVTAMSADQASLVLTATTSATYGSVVVTRIFTLAKSRAGTNGTNGIIGSNGLSSKILDAVADKQLIVYDGTGALVLNQNVSLRAYKQNTTATVAWTITTFAGTVLNSSTYLTSGSGTRTNLIAYSEKLGAAASSSWWTDTLLSITPDATAAPDGSVTADLIIPTTTSGTHRLQRSGFGTGAIGDVVTVTVYAKSSGYDFLHIAFPCVNNNNCIFNVTTGTVATQGSGWTCVITDAGNGWYRCSATGTTTATSGTCGYWVSSANSTAAFAGNGTSGIYMWGAQMAVEAAAGPYIRTDGAAVTAVIGEAITLSGANFNTARGATDGVILTATLADGAPIQDTVSINRIQAGVSAIGGYLTNESQTLAADNAGTVSDFSPATGSFKVYSGTTDISTGFGTSYSSTVTGCTGSINAATGVYTVSAMSADTASLNISAVTSSTYGSVTITKVFTLSKSKAGSIGASAKIVTISTDRQAVLYDGLGALNPGGTVQSVQFTANKRNTTQTTNWTVTQLDGTATGLVAASNYFSTTAAGGTGTSTADVVYMTPAQFNAARGSTNGVIVSATVVDGTSLVDTTTILRLQAGVSAVAGMLTNESQTLASDNAGLVSDYSTATGTFKVYYGSTDITTGQGTTFSAATGAGCTGSINASTGVYSVTSMTADIATITLTATTTSTYGNAVVTKVFSLAKAKTGPQGSTGLAGANAKLLTVSSDRQTITFSNNSASPSVQTVTFNATKASTTGTVSWSIASLGAPTTYLTPVTNYLSAATGDTVTMTVAQFNSARGSAAGVTVVSSVTDGVTFTDQISVVRIDSGATSVVGYLTNESAVLAADSAGTVGSFAAASGTFRVYYGATDVTTGASTTFAAGTLTNCSATINATTGAYSVTALTADTGSFAMTATTSSANGSVVVTKTLTLAKSKSGATGSAGANAKLVVISTDRNSILVDGVGNFNPSGTAQSVRLSANTQNTVGTPSWTITKIDGTATTSAASVYLSTTATGGTGTSSGSLVYLTPTQFDSARAATSGVIVTVTVDGISDSTSILRLQAGGSSADGYLTNESQVLGADFAGTVADYSAATGSFKTFYGTTDISTGAGTVYAVASQTGCTGTINASTGIYSVSAMSADTATLTLTATASSTYGSAVVTKVFSLSKSKTGAVGGTGPSGAPAKTIFVISDRQTISYNTSGSLNPVTQTTTFTAYKQNSTVAIAWAISDTLGNALSQTLLTSIDTGSGTAGGSCLLTAANFSTAIATNNAQGVVVTATIVDGATLADKVSLLKVSDGAVGSQGAAGVTPLVGYLTNESHTIATDSTGGGYTLPAGATGIFKVFLGTTDVTSSSTFSTLSSSNATVTFSGSTYTLASLTADLGSVTLRATYQGVNIDKTFSIAKSKSGATGNTGNTGSAGASAKTLLIISDRQTVSYDGTGALNPSTQTTSFTAVKQNTTNAVTWSITDINGVAQSSALLSTTSGDTMTITAANFETGRNGTTGVIVTGTLTDGSVLTDKISVVRIVGGAAGSAGATGPVGPTGPAAKTIMVISDRQAITYDGTGAINPTSQTTTFTALKQNTTNTVSWTISDASGVAASTSYLSATTGDQISITAANFNAARNSTQGVIVTGTVVDGTTINDKIGLVMVQNGSAGATGPTGSPGAPAKTLIIISDRQSITYDGSGSLSPSSQTITLSALKQNTSATVTWTLTDSVGNAIPAGTYLSATTGDTVTMTAPNFNGARNGSTGIIVTGTIVDGSTITDKIGIVMVSSGAAGSAGPTGPTGPAGPSIALSAPKTQMNYVDGILTPSSQTVTITAALSGISGTINWTTSPNVKTGTGTSFSLTETEFQVDANAEVVVTATVGSVSNSISISRVEKFSAAYQTNINTAYNYSNQAITFVNDVTDNNKFSKDEKKRYVNMVNNWVTQVPSLVAQGRATGLTTESTALETAWSNFYIYLVNTAQYLNLGNSTGINRSVFQNYERVFHDALVTLANAETKIVNQKGANVLYNGSFILGKTAWTDVAKVMVFAADYRGNVIEPQFSTSGTGVLQSSRPFTVTPGEYMTISAQFSGISTNAAFTFVDIEWRNTNNGASISYSSGTAGANTCIFSNTTATRYRASATVLVPAATDSSSTVKGYVRVVQGQDVAYRVAPNAATIRWVEQIKIERGTFASPFSDEATNGSYLSNAVGRFNNGATTMPTNWNVGIKAINSTGFALSDTAAGTTVTLNIAASTYILDTGTLNYVSGSATGLAYATMYFVFRNDPNLNGGTSYGTSTVLSDALGTGKVYLGYFTTRATSTTTGGGGGGGGYVEYCVSDDAIVVTDRGEVPAHAVVAGDRVRVLAKTFDGTEWETIQSNEVAENECVRIKTKSATLTLALNTPVVDRSGNWTYAANAWMCTLPVLINGKFGWETVSSVEYVGKRNVAHIKCNNATYAAGDNPGAAILTHNPTAAKQ